MRIYDFSNVKRIDFTGIYYHDEYNQVRFIDFLICRKNWSDHENCRKFFTTMDGRIIQNIKPEENHCVGKRNWFNHPPYYQFFLDDNIRFEIKPKKTFLNLFHPHWRQKYYQHFLAIEEILNANGWHTFI